MVPITDTYYRPRWVGGNYDAAANVALLINRLTNESHFYKGDSAEIINEILKAKRDEMFRASDLCSATRTRMEDFMPFVKKLQSQGLVTDKYPSAEMETEVRAAARKRNLERAQNGDFDDKAQVWKIVSYVKAINKITEVMIETTYNCSEQCLHCYNAGATRNNDEKSGRNKPIPLSMDDYKRVIDELSDLGVYLIKLSGGDPFSNPHIWEIIDYIYQKDLTYEIYTNGQRLTNDIVRLAKYFPCRISVSLYSSIASQHDYITRVRGSFDRSVEVLKGFSELGVSTNIKCTIMRPGFKGYHGIVDIARKYGSTLELSGDVASSVDGDYCPVEKLHLNAEEMEMLFMDKNCAEYDVLTKDNKLEQMVPGYCAAGNIRLNITPSGDVTPCCGWNQILGNVKESSIKDIIDSSDELKRIQTFLASDFEECFKHDYCSVCSLCPGSNYIETGSFAKPASYHCYWAKKTFDFIKKVKEEGYNPLQGKSLEERISEFPDYVPEKLHRMIKVRGRE